MNLSVEQAMPGKMSLQVGYVGTRGMRLPVFVDANLLGVKRRTAAHATPCRTQATTSPRRSRCPVICRPTGATQRLPASTPASSVANTWYNSMAVTVRRPFANGLEVACCNYTWAKATDTGQVGGANGTFYGGDTPSDPNNIRFDNGPSDIDVPTA